MPVRDDVGAIAVHLDAEAAEQRVHLRRVIIAEDDDAMRCLLVEHFVRHGWRVMEAVDGAHLLAQLRLMAERPHMAPDLVISDERMPRMSGLDVLRALSHEGLRYPFILITSFGDASLHASAERLGALMTLDKPVDLDVLAELAATAIAAERRLDGLRSESRR